MLPVWCTDCTCNEGPVYISVFFFSLSVFDVIYCLAGLCLVRAPSFRRITYSWQRIEISIDERPESLSSNNGTQRKFFLNTSTNTTHVRSKSAVSVSVDDISVGMLK